MSLDSLKLLEEKIGEFVEEHERVRERAEALVLRLRDREEELAKATSQLKQYEEERSAMKERLERILGRLENLDLT